MDLARYCITLNGLDPFAMLVLIATGLPTPVSLVCTSEGSLPSLTPFVVRPVRPSTTDDTTLPVGAVTISSSDRS